MEEEPTALEAEKSGVLCQFGLGMKFTDKITSTKLLQINVHLNGGHSEADEKIRLLQLGILGKY